MPDYQEMYLTLFRATTKAITLLQEAQIQTEELFILAEDAPLAILTKANSDEGDVDATSGTDKGKTGTTPHFSENW